MKKQYAELQRISDNQTITEESNYRFINLLQNSLLLALREQGRLNPMQHRHAEELLKKQSRDRAKRKPKEL